MIRYFVLFAVTLATPVAAKACESVQLIAPQAVYAAPVQLVAPIVYQPVVQAQVVAQPHCVQAFVAPQQVVVQRQVVRQKVVRQRMVVHY